MKTITNKQANKQTSKQANKQTSKQANKQTSKQTSKQANKQTNKQKHTPVTRATDFTNLGPKRLVIMRTWMCKSPRTLFAATPRIGSGQSLSFVGARFFIFVKCASGFRGICW